MAQTILLASVEVPPKDVKLQDPEALPHSFQSVAEEGLAIPYVKLRL
jgi:hypothetical protein